MSRANEVVVVGVGQLRNNRERTVDQAREPLDLIEHAAGLAADDAGLTAATLASIDLLDVVQVVSWTYDDAAARLAGRLGCTDAVTTVSGVGGHQPVARVNDLVRRLASGEGRIALLAGGEAQASLELLARDGLDNPWSRTPGGFASFPREVAGTEAMWDLGLVAPIRVYPLFENRLRHELGQSFEQAHQWSGRMYSQFSEAAVANPAAWDPTARTPSEITAVGPGNRMICWPYPLRMNANNRVDQAGAVLLMTGAAADDLGVPDAKRVRVVSGASAADSEDILERPGYGASAGLGHVLDTVLADAGLGPTDLDVLDLYSCFPVVPKLAALHLKAVDRPLSVTGGLSSFGGAHNDYSTHAVIATVHAVRAGGGTGLVYANGEYLTKHAAVVLSSQSHGGPPVIADDEVDPPGPAAPPWRPDHLGDAVVETYTVEFDREARPARAWVIATTPQGERTAARVSKTDAATLAALTDTGSDPIGRAGTVVADGGRRQFVIGA